MSRLLRAMPPQPPDLGQLYEAHARRVFRTLSRLGVPSAAIEDAVQDVFLTAHQQLDGFEGKSELSTWLVGIAVRVASNLRRTAQRRKMLRLADTTVIDPGSAPDMKLSHQRELHELNQVLSGLPDEQREVVVLMDLEQLTAPQVAQALEVKVNTVYSRLRLGRAALTRALSPAPEALR